MAALDKNRLLQELKTRLDRLDCVHPITKGFIKRFAEARLSPIDLQDYLAPMSPADLGRQPGHRLALVEQYIASVDDPAFRHLCEELAPISDPEELMARLGLKVVFNQAKWLSYAFQVQFHTAKCLFCVANHTCLPITD